MATVEPGIARHYEISGLEERIIAALADTGVDVAHLRAGDLEAVDEFHIGGVAATRDLISQLGLKPGARLLDIGSGIGGPARFVANNAGVDVTGIDLTQSYVDIATSLSRRTGMAGKTHFVQGSALDMPFAKAGFDAAMILHVGMNLPDKAKLMSEAARVLKPGGVFAVYDVMRLKDGALTYPLPWASNETISFVATPDDYRSAAAAAGFSVTAERPRGAFAVEFFAAMRARLAAAQAEGRKPSPGLGLVMGEDARTKMANLIAALEGGILAPVELLLRLG
ncbi:MULTISPECIES: methyltransferase domain-containing protein [unclassified Mesorhizobium]|uniref:class I SAM-dependent methyltransferase n=1 Tax=unclassified Mesorhizobium TaxID=325217 RepID=UPI000FD4ABA9|nr:MULTISPECIES: methyltransferase domain-containing protein [unclassified Mesorhizobium]RUX03241.1 methyltransferase domain-containing protein [Mesorhizobium sp. M8A.F.Ca.ET.023.01.1.1]RWC75026.1 MAG: methyltransferase domain-containing protein [Mesorhizobium sp.]TGP90133.1 methyltransferase domain-containing protein [Mesorhizobium sp. M8A.F.Ca.ET.218.01.1.1]TGT16625.1 methyltransferase domain-containing protein [Mesorhizobium sp. M8A.F.Ca.ET.213.01.1.1]TGT90329.1 methyltransferase domain-con